jgi:hypothetical protein
MNPCKIVPLLSSTIALRILIKLYSAFLLYFPYESLLINAVHFVFTCRGNQSQIVLFLCSIFAFLSLLLSLPYLTMTDEKTAIRARHNTVPTFLLYLLWESLSIRGVPFVSICRGNHKKLHYIFVICMVSTPNNTEVPILFVQTCFVTSFQILRLKG